MIDPTILVATWRDGCNPNPQNLSRAGRYTTPPSKPIT